MLKKITLLVVAMSVVLGLWSCGNNGTVEPTCGFESETYWDFLIAEVIEAIPLIYPDTQAAYLFKFVPPDENVAYKIEFTLPYATYSSTTTYQDNKPFAALRDAQYITETGTPNPYQPGNLIMTPQDQRTIVLYVTPDFDSAVAQGVRNPIAIGTTEERNLIFQRVYYANRTHPFSDKPFDASRDFDRLGYTIPERIWCVDPQSLETPVRCPHFNPLQDIPAINFNIEEGRTPPPSPPANCPNRLRWDRPQLEAVHYAGPGSLNNTGKNIPDPETTCTGYLLTMVWEPDHKIVMTRIETPPTFFDVSTIDGNTIFPDPVPDTRYIGIQNYGTYGSDVRYNQQSRSVGEIITWPDNISQQAGQEWIFLHYARPIEQADEATIKSWAAGNNINEQQLAIYKEGDEHPPFLIYRNKETSDAFKDSTGYIRESVPCFSAADDIWENSPISYAADGSNMGSYVPITITCDIVNPGNLTDQDLDDCLATLIATDPDWANCTP